MSENSQITILGIIAGVLVIGVSILANFDIGPLDNALLKLATDGNDTNTVVATKSDIAHAASITAERGNFYSPNFNTETYKIANVVKEVGYCFEDIRFTNTIVSNNQGYFYSTDGIDYDTYIKKYDLFYKLNYKDGSTSPDIIVKYVDNKVRDLAYINSDGSVSYWSVDNTTKLANVDIGEMTLDEVYKEYFIS